MKHHLCIYLVITFFNQYLLHKFNVKIDLYMKSLVSCDLNWLGYIM